MDKLKAILFDFDGTIVNSAPGIVKTMEQTYMKMGLPVPSQEAMITTIGLPLKQALGQLASLDDSMATRATEIYRELFPIYEVNYVTLFDEVYDILSTLKAKGIRMAVVTSRDFSSLDLICRHHDLWGFFETKVTGADGFKPKPAPDMVHALLKEMNLSNEEAIVVGDTTFDIDMGNSADCKTVAVTYGNHQKERLLASNPDYTIDSFSDLLAIVKDLS